MIVPELGRRVRLAAVLVAAALMGACSTGTPLPAATTMAPVNAPAIPTIPDDVRAQRGTLVSAEPMRLISTALRATDARAVRVVYRSASGIDGSARTVSGSVFIPKGTAPPDGWPLISFGHGTTGISGNCGPSTYPDLLGYDLVVASFVKVGWAVALTDYEGLDGTGTLPYFEPNTAGFDIIDAVRAARAVDSHVSDRWVALGVSEGGQAAWAANEVADSYADGLRFLGSVSLSPAADMSGEADLAATGWLSADQQSTFPMLINGIRVTHPELALQDYLHGPYATNPEMWLACTGPLVAKRLRTAATLSAADSTPSSDAATARLTAALRELAVPRRKASGPMLVITGDADTMVRPQWVRRAVTRACGIGDTVQLVVRPNEGHNNLQPGPTYSAWIADRLAGTPAPRTC